MKIFKKNEFKPPLPKIHKSKKKFTERYKYFCYRILGKNLIKNEKKHIVLDTNLKKANVRYSSSIFLSTIIITTILTFFISLFIYSIIFTFIFPSNYSIIFIFVLTGVTTAITTGFLPFVIKSKISARKTQIDHELPFILSEMSILASTGLTPIRIMHNMAEREGNTPVNQEFRKIIYKTDVEGKDIITAISETAKESPSSLFRETLWDLANMLHQGGDLDGYLRQRADTTLEIKRNIQEEFIEKLGTYTEMYITLVVMGILFIGIAAFLLNAMGSTISGLTADSLLQILAYAIIPLTIVVVNILFSLAYSRSG